MRGVTTLWFQAYLLKVNPEADTVIGTVGWKTIDPLPLRLITKTQDTERARRARKAPGFWTSRGQALPTTPDAFRRNALKVMGAYAQKARASGAAKNAKQAQAQAEKMLAAKLGFSNTRSIRNWFSPTDAVTGGFRRLPSAQVVTRMQNLARGSRGEPWTWLGRDGKPEKFPVIESTAVKELAAVLPDARRIYSVLAENLREYGDNLRVLAFGLIGWYPVKEAAA